MCMMVLGPGGADPPPAAGDLDTGGGPDPETGRWLTHLLPQISPCLRVGILGGPLIAPEVLKGVPTAAIVASRYDEVNRLGQAALHSAQCRVYTGDDPEAVERAPLGRSDTLHRPAQGQFGCSKRV